MTALSKPDPRKDFIYDILIYPNEETLHRLVVDFQTDVNIMGDHVLQSLNMKPSHCEQSTLLQVARMGEAIPSGCVDVKWSLHGDREGTVYESTFYVVGRCRFDLLLGRPSVIGCGLSKKDPAVKERMRLSY